MSQQTECYALLNGQEVGPISAVVLQQLTKQGQVGPETQIRIGVDGEWIPARRIKGLGPYLVHSPRAVERSETTMKRDSSKTLWRIGAVAVALCATITIIWSLLSAGMPSPSDDKAGESVNQSAQQLNHLSDRANQQVQRLKRRTEWLDKFTKLLSGESSNVGRFEGLERMGFIVKMDHEAKLAIVDQFGWDVLSEVERGRYMAASVVSQEMSHLRGLMDGSHVKDTTIAYLKNGEVTLFSSDTGKSLAWVDSKGECHIFR